MAIAILPKHCQTPERTLDIETAGQENGTRVQIWEVIRHENEMARNQEFLLGFNDDGTVTAFPRHCETSRRCLTVTDDCVRIWDDEGRPSQRWTVEMFPSGLAFRSATGNGYLEVKGGSREMGASVGVYPHDIHPAHAIWLFKVSSFKNATREHVGSIDHLDQLRIKLLADRDAKLGEAVSWWHHLLPQTNTSDASNVEKAMTMVNGRCTEFCTWFRKVVVEHTLQDCHRIDGPSYIKTQIGRKASLVETISPPPIKGMLRRRRQGRNVGSMWDEVGQLKWQLECWTESLVGTVLGSLLIRTAIAERQPVIG